MMGITSHQLCLAFSNLVISSGSDSRGAFRNSIQDDELLVAKAVDVSLNFLEWLASLRLGADELLSRSKHGVLSDRSQQTELSLRCEFCQTLRTLKVVHSLLDDESNQLRNGRGFYNTLQYGIIIFNLRESMFLLPLNYMPCQGVSNYLEHWNAVAVLLGLWYSWTTILAY